ncbi:MULTISPECIES: cell wall metabolism sensor histidine kinase WalK [Streptomyces]|uniref:sensor histidine kinase n=1 Tax=Streptomyces TaxID=1883 RepID=UPI00103CC8FD|nr:MULTISPECIES: HAMP domain-containing sensor histidine kinase [Streptomyces]MBT3077052.1 HAMP domain-containing histidine kinase [Streptomyces sp. COG21]MBT3082367.1 HAMP domain-containing histidine kinase [Streptomyces sp. COG20]MBT3097144.1 HAMP domain-containing histidine kinase [Streptomyces sp. CBG30]MBT3104340.1 HAMP domain-containing histidine kinase [Streptomyces sp. COG19]MBT3110645.1 HAMP domain-containing histidine kinase [Streptomyces sp. CYG20]
MTPRARLRRLVTASKLPHSTIRTRIALVYGGVFLVLGTALLTTVNLASRAGTDSEARAIASAVVVPPGYTVNGPFIARSSADGPTVYELTDHVSDAASKQHMYWSIAALLVMTAGAVGVGWWIAGRVLRPVHAMTAKARSLSERTLHERIASSGPDDELKELGETLDALLARLEKAFDSQRRFIANASHELRTPLATQRAAIQVGLDNPSPDDLVRTRQTLLDTNRRSERLIEGLLVLARSERGLAADEREDVRFDRVVAEETARRPGARREGPGRPEVSVEVAPCPVRGNRLLLSQLVSNLLANAVTYNVPDGSVDITLAEDGALVVRNTGPVVSEADIAGFFEPFRRGEGRDRMGPGSGLGLSIVRSIAVAHGGTVTAVPGPGGGGLAVTVRLPVDQSVDRPADQPSERSSRAAIQAGSPARISR